MGFLMGGNTTPAVSTEDNKLNAVQIQQSTYGTVIPVGYGTFRLAGNVIDYIDFKTISHVTSGGGGGGGGKGGGPDAPTNTTYTYTVRALIGICQGAIQGIHKVWKGKVIDTMANAKLSLFKGTELQTAWGEMLTYHPDRALNYRNLAYAAGNLDLGNSSSIPNFSFEVSALFGGETGESSLTESFDFTTEEDIIAASKCVIVYSSYYISHIKMSIRYFTKNGVYITANDYKNYTYAKGIYTVNLAALNCSSATVSITYKSTNQLDANPGIIIYDLLTNVNYGAGFPADYVGDLSDFSNYCNANELRISPNYTTQAEAQKLVTDIVSICNSNFVWSQGKLNIIPAGDSKIVGKDATWVPNLTPIYDLNNDDYLTQDSPVNCVRSTQVDTYNSVKLEYLNRTNNYNVEVVEASDRANQEIYGIRPADVVSAHIICDTKVAKKTVQLCLDRTICFRNHYIFKASIKYILLDPMDLITISDEDLGLDRELVRIIGYRESEEDELEFEVQEMALGSATPAIYEHQDSTRTSIDFNKNVGNVNPAIIFEPPFELTVDTLEVWAGTSNSSNYFGGAQVWISDDGDTYVRKGEIKVKCRQGILDSSLPTSLIEIDENNTLKVDLTMSKATILSGTKKDAINNNTLCYVDGELISYETSTLTDTNKYDINYLVRGSYGTAIKEHGKGTQFARVDNESFLKIPFNKEDVGKKLFIKFLSFNIFGGGCQSLADVEPYSYTIKGTALSLAPEDIKGLTDYYTDGLNVITWNSIDDTRTVLYEIRKGKTWKLAQQLGRVSGNTFTANGNGTYYIKAYIPDYDVYSDNEVAIEISGARLVKNVVIDVDDKELGWFGVMDDNLAIDENNNLMLAGSGIFGEIPVFSEESSIIYYGVQTTYGIYEFSRIVDIGELGTCYINVDYLFFGDNRYSKVDSILNFDEVADIDGNFGPFITGARIQIATIKDDSNVYGDWRDFITGQYYGKKFKFRAVFQSSSDTVVCKLSKFSVSVDVPDVLENGNNVIIPSLNTTIVYTKKFHDIPNVQITILGKEQGDDDFITNITQTSFDIVIKNEGIPVSRAINYSVQGY